MNLFWQADSLTSCQFSASDHLIVDETNHPFGGKKINEKKKSIWQEIRGEDFPAK